MGLYVKDFDMPKNCMECRFSELFGWDDETGCLLKKGVWQNYKVEHRHPKCPLVEVPPHGDLIDRDALVHDTVHFIHKMMVFGGDYVYSQSAIDSAPVVIEADQFRDVTKKVEVDA